MDCKIMVGREPFLIAALVVTTRRTFEKSVEIKFEEGKLATFDLEFF